MRTAGGDPAKGDAADAVGDAKEEHQLSGVRGIANAPNLDPISDNHQRHKKDKAEKAIAGGKDGKAGITPKQAKVDRLLEGGDELSTAEHVLPAAPDGHRWGGVKGGQANAEGHEAGEDQLSAPPAVRLDQLMNDEGEDGHAKTAAALGDAGGQGNLCLEPVGDDDDLTDEDHANAAAGDDANGEDVIVDGAIKVHRENDAKDGEEGAKEGNQAGAVNFDEATGKGC